MALETPLNVYADSRPGLVARIRDAIAGSRKYHRIRDELAAHSDRELADLGLSRLNVRDAALDAVYGR